MIGIVDYGMGNLGSVTNACAFLGIEARVIGAPIEMAECEALILPGVGAFGDCMRHLRSHGFVGAVREWIGAGRPFLGICLGLQVLFESSEECPGEAGLGIFAGSVRRFRTPRDLKVPQIGWNRVAQAKPGCPLFEGIPDGAHFYFVHSYYVDPADASLVAGRTGYGGEYCSAVWKDNAMAVQFHPEKSQRHGLRMLRNFAEWARRDAGAEVSV